MGTKAPLDIVSGRKPVSSAGVPALRVPPAAGSFSAGCLRQDALRPPPSAAGSLARMPHARPSPRTGYLERDQTPDLTFTLNSECPTPVPPACPRANPVYIHTDTRTCCRARFGANHCYFPFWRRSLVAVQLVLFFYIHILRCLLRGAYPKGRFLFAVGVVS